MNEKITNARIAGAHSVADQFRHDTEYSRSDFKAVSMVEQYFTSCTFKACRFTGGYFKRVTFRDCVFDICEFAGVVFKDCQFLNCRVKNALFEACLPENSFASNTIFLSCVFKSVTLTAMRYYVVDMDGCTFQNSEHFELRRTPQLTLLNSNEVFPTTFS